MKVKNGKELVKRSEVKDTPFIIIQTKGKAFGVMGKYRLTEDFKTKKEVEEKLKEMTWNNIVNVIAAIVDTATNKQQ